MKKSFYILITVSLIYSFHLASQTIIPGSFANAVIQDTQWEQSTDGYWVGRNNTLYKFDEYRNLMYSENGISWEYHPEPIWEDRFGNLLTYQDYQLFSSDNQGLTWVNIPKKTWLGWDGNYYRFDENGRLWKKQGVFEENL